MYSKFVSTESPTALLGSLEDAKNVIETPDKAPYAWIDICLGGTIILILLLVPFLRWLEFPADSRYLLPVDADDWVAWGTWGGATGAVLAVVYAARSVRQALAAQQSQERQRDQDRINREAEKEREEADRKTARDQAVRDRDTAWDRERQDRESERDLAATTREAERDRDTELRRIEREHDLAERKRMQLNRDRVARMGASSLTWKVGTGRPVDSEYESIWVELYAPQQDQYDGSAQRDQQRSDDNISSIYILITNTSTDSTFTDLSLRLLEPGKQGKVVAIERRTAPPEWDGRNRLNGQPPVWEPVTMDEYIPVYPSATNQWAMESPSAGEQLMVVVQLDKPRDRIDWSWDPNNRQGPGAPRGGHLILAFADADDRFWVRSTHAFDDVPYRVWELGDEISKQWRNSPVRELG